MIPPLVDRGPGRPALGQTLGQTLGALAAFAAGLLLALMIAQNGALSRATDPWSAPGAADGVGSLVAIDCQKGDMILISGYSPKKPLEVPADWRKTASKKIDGADDKALMAGVCAGAAALPTK